MRYFVILLAALILIAPASPGLAQYEGKYGKSLAPYVPSPQPVVEKMLEAAKVRPNEVVYDLGSGDGRVLVTAARKFRAQAVGIEISPELVDKAKDRIEDEGVEKKCKVIQGDAREVDLSPADVVVLYLLTSSNELLRPNLEKSLKPGARVVSHDFEIQEWNPSKVVQAEVHGRIHSIFVYEFPVSK